MRVIVDFGHANAGLTPSFTSFMRADTLAPVTPPAITELAAIPGLYYFDYTPSPTIPEIVYEIDGGVAIEVESSRYIRGGISYGEDSVFAQLGLDRALGLMKENAVLDNTLFDAMNNMTAARLRIYASKADAVNKVSPLQTYTIEASYVPETNNLATYQMVLEPSLPT